MSESIIICIFANQFNRKICGLLTAKITYITMKQKYIYESERWPNFIWDKVSLSEKQAVITRKAGHLFGRLHDIGFDTQLRTMTENMTDSVVDSYSIEGITLNAAQVRSSVARRLGLDLPKHTEPSHYVDGIVEMMLDATTKYRTPLSHERLMHWHTALFPPRTSPDIIIGDYRTSAMDVISGMLGRERVHYHAPESAAIPQMMKQFIEWYNLGSNHDYIRSAVAHLYFISIHPFDDGNGRIARALSDMALSQADDSPMRYFSMSSQINKEKKQYYKILERTQKSDGNISEWINWWLDCLGHAIDISESNLTTILRKSLFWQRNTETSITDRQRMVLNLYLDGYEGKLTVKNYAKQAEVSTDTAARDIKELIEKGILQAKGDMQRNVEYEIL